ncbi:MAG TPA: hypothetical protein VFF28_04375 [Candidatus Nanoarchaeia archaeon]|nr:hypothetical protein [Candidatus Nanoarchaeia archaeon]
MEELYAKITGLFGDIVRGQGLNDSLLAMILARLYIEPEPIAMDELAKETGYSLASVCNKIKMLGPLVTVSKKPGSKKIYLFMDKNIIGIWKDMLAKKQQVLASTKEKLPLIIKESRKRAKTADDKKRVEIVEGFFDQISKVEGLLKKMMDGFDEL